MSASYPQPTGEAVILDAQRIARCIQRSPDKFWKTTTTLTALWSPPSKAKGGSWLSASRLNFATLTHRRPCSASWAWTKTPHWTTRWNSGASDGSPFDNQLMAGAVVIVVDDVLNSGRTLLHGVAHFLPSAPSCGHLRVGGPHPQEVPRAGLTMWAKAYLPTSRPTSPCN